jgi:hypothetical protein
MLTNLHHPGRKAAHPVVLRIAALALVGAGLSGCQSIDTNNNAQLRVVDAAPDAGPLDAYQNNTGLAYNLSFGNETSYVAMVPGTYTLSADKASTRQTLVTTSSTLLAGHQYTEIIGNTAANLQQTILQDKITPAASGQIELRLVHEATHSGAVDIYLVANNGGRPTSLVTDLNFGRNTGYINVPAGTYAIDIVPTGTVLVSSTVTLQSGPQNEYLSGSVRTFVLIDEETIGLQKSSLTTGVQTLSLDDVDAP